MKKKVLFVISQFYKGGAEVALLNLFKQLNKEKYEVDFLVFDQIVLSNAVSLLSQVPEWINVCNASEREGKFSILYKVVSKLIQKTMNKQIYRKSAYDFVKNKKYDMAFSYGEWMSPEFVARKVTSKEKSVWIHTDVDKAKFVTLDTLFGFENNINKYLFVSNQSKESALHVRPSIEHKSYVVHNSINKNEITLLSEIPISEIINREQKVLVTVANLRKEKNHLRQVEVMKLLKNREVDFIWINIGSTANRILHKQVMDKACEYGLENKFLLLGANENPYPYMKIANAVAVLSDFESWSLVITEAKIIGTPVLATKTSGAMEQIQNYKDGILMDFDNESIADAIEAFLRNDPIERSIREHLKEFTYSDIVSEEFEKILK